MSELTDSPRPSGYVMTLEAHRAWIDELTAAHAADLAALRATAVGLLDELIAWFGAPDWIGPQLPLPLARRIAEFLEAGDAGVAAGPQAAPDRVAEALAHGRIEALRWAVRGFLSSWADCTPPADLANYLAEDIERMRDRVRVVAVPTDHEDPTDGE